LPRKTYVLNLRPVLLGEASHDVQNGTRSDQGGRPCPPRLELQAATDDRHQHRFSQALAAVAGTAAMADERLFAPMVVTQNTEVIGLWAALVRIEPTGGARGLTGTPWGSAAQALAMLRYDSTIEGRRLQPGDASPQKVHSGIVDHDGLSSRSWTQRDKNANDAHTEAAHVDR
jgi:hypothetical protein